MKRTVTVILLLFVWSSFSAYGANLRVRVFERGADIPLPGVSVCLGTHARMDQFGAARTDAEGYVLFSEVPHAQIIVTASMPGFQSTQETMVTSNTNRMLVLSLTAGGGGPECSFAARTASPISGGLIVTHFRINSGAVSTDTRTVRLDNSLNGVATQFRVSERSDMEGAQWQDYVTSPEFSLSKGPGLKRVYLQVRRHSTVDGATLEAVSPIVEDTIRLN